MTVPLRYARGGLALTALALAACRPATTPEEDYRALETRMLAADSVGLTFDVTADGVVSAALAGELRLEPDGKTIVEVTGSFAGEPVSLRLETHGDAYYSYGNALQRTMDASPEALREALVIGFLRMGILHDLARLVSAEAPDHAAGGVSDRVTVDNFARSDDGIGFALTVAGEPAGSASLRLDSAGAPSLRRQTVRFPGGEMHVTETYANLTIAP